MTTATSARPPEPAPTLTASIVRARLHPVGLGLLLGRRSRSILFAVAVQMAATFLVLLLRPDVAFVGGNPLVLSVEGEYVVKNLVLLAAALTLIEPRPARRSRLVPGNA